MPLVFFSVSLVDTGGVSHLPGPLSKGKQFYVNGCTALGVRTANPLAARGGSGTREWERSKEPPMRADRPWGEPGQPGEDRPAAISCLRSRNHEKPGRRFGFSPTRKFLSFGNQKLLAEYAQSAQLVSRSLRRRHS